MTSVTSNSNLLVVMDPEYGARLEDVSVGRPVWIAMSPTNAAVVRYLSETRTDDGSGVGVTGFEFDGGVSGEDSFLNHMDAIDLHHGPHSFPADPYTALEVVGASLRPDIRALLAEIGFTQFAQIEGGFAAYRDIEAARRLRR